MGGILGIIDRNFRLTNEPGGLGLSCTAAGLALAGVPLLQKSATAFAVRPAADIEALIRAAYGDDVVLAAVLPGIEAVARALSRGELARAMVLAVMTRLPELGWGAAARLAAAEDRLRKQAQPEDRDWHGRWTDGDSVDGPIAESSRDLVGSDPTRNLLDPTPRPTLFSDDGSLREEAEDELGGSSPLEQEYDHLRPVELADKAIRFGDWLAREGKNLSPEDRENALAEYSFLERRILFWNSYGYKPFEAAANLNSAALSLFFGAQLAGIRSVEQIPLSMASVAIGAMLSDEGQRGLQPRRSPARTEMEHEAYPGGRQSTFEENYHPNVEISPADPSTGTVSFADVGVPWKAAIQPRGIAWQNIRAAKYPGNRRLGRWSKSFDSYNDGTEEAISEKTLNTLDFTYASNPKNVFSKLKQYIDQAADYWNRRIWYDLDPRQIKSKTIELAIPQFVSPQQWQQLSKAVEYGRIRGVKVNITVDKVHGSP